jgi:capsular exopolysaccharide synthesis family protein
MATMEQNDVRSAAAASFEAAASVVTIDEPTGMGAEAIRALRTQLMTVRNRDGLTSLAICGPESSVGCTFVAVNLAVSLSQIGVKTLLVDGNLRNPAVHRMILPPPGVAGLQQCLLGELDVDDAIQHDVIDNLSLLYAGGSALSPQELLSAPRFRELVELWSREYDFTIVDTPPANQSADGRYIAGVLGAAVVVVRQDHTAVSNLRTILNELEGSEAAVVGTVLNQF